MRKIETHKVNGLNDAIEITVLDEPGPGNACHAYNIRGGDPVGFQFGCDIRFQKGPVKEAGFNGISNESLLAVVRDRLEGFQSGPFACDANATALDAVTEAMDVLHARTRERMERNVEGSNVA